MKTFQLSLKERSRVHGKEVLWDVGKHISQMESQNKQKSMKELSLCGEFTFLQIKVMWQIRGHEAKKGVLRVKINIGCLLRDMQFYSENISHKCNYLAT